MACKCGLSYHLKFNPSRAEGVCDKCGSVLFKRDDDKPEAIKKRLEIYHQETEPLFDIYEGQGILHRVNGEASIDDVYQTIEAVIKK